MSIHSYISDRWDKLVFALLTVCITAAAVGLEFRYSYVEWAIGRYLLWHNVGRQEIGRVWESVTVSDSVQQKLDHMVEDLRQQEAVDERIDDLEHLVELVTKHERVIMTRDRFLEMYSALPVYQRTIIMEPINMLELIGRYPSWQRTLIVLEGGRLCFYLVDGFNNVLDSIFTPAEYISFCIAEQSTQNQPLDAIPSLAGNIYPADVFFDALVLLSPQERSGIPLTPTELITWRYRLQRVAVSREQVIGDRIEMGFELTGDNGVQTIRILARSMSVLSLMNKMDEILFLRQPYPEPPKEAAPAPGAFPDSAAVH